MSQAIASLGPRARRDTASRLMIIGAALLAALAIIAAFAPLIAPHDPEAVEVRRVLGAPDLLHPFGSDVLGRDVLSRVIYGLRVSLIVSLSAVAGSLLFAVPLGLVAGYFGRWVDTIISRAIDLILVFPAMLLAVTFIAPVFAVLYGAVFLGERITLWMVGCALVIVCGTLLSTGLISTLAPRRAAPQRP